MITVDYLIKYGGRLMNQKAASLFVGAVVSLLVGMGVFAQINQRAGLKDDNIVEEGFEKVIKAVTGNDEDITPDSPEDDS